MTRLAALTVALALHAGTLIAGEFEKTFGGADFDRGVYVSPTRDGGYIALGTTKSFGEGKEDIYLVRTDADGVLRWSQTYGGSDEELGWSVLEMAEGFVIAGSTRSFGAGGSDCYLLRTDALGEVEWSKTYGGTEDEHCWALENTSGGLVLVGETKSSGEGEEDCFLIKTDASGSQLWQRTYGGSKGDRCFAIAPAEDGGYVLAGQTYSEGAGDRDAWVIKTDEAGALQWSRTFGGPASDVGHAVVRSMDGAFVVTGYTASFASEGDDPYLMKVDAQGETIWTRVLPMEGRNRTLTGEEAVDGGFFLVGFSQAQGGRPALLVKTDREGHLEWRRDVLPSTRGESFGYTVRATDDGGCVFAGHTTEGAAGSADLLLVKIRGEPR